MLERIRQILTARALSPTQFADAIGVGRPVVSHVLSGRNKPSLEVIQKIVDAFPELSLPWLLKGEGPMLAAAPAVAPSPDSTEAVSVPVTDTPRKKQRTTALPASKAASEEKKPAAAPTVPESPAPVSSNAGEATAPAAALPPDAAAVSPPATATTLPEVLAVAPTGKAIRRIIIFYRDGTFTDYQPEP